MTTPRRRAALAGAGLCLLLLLAVLVPPVAAGRFWAGGDSLIQDFPQRLVAGWAFRHGEFPFWDPYLFGGMPFFAASQPGMLCPASWPGMLCSLPVAANLTVTLALLLMMGGSAAFVGALGLSPWAAATAAVAFPFGGFVGSYLGTPSLLEALASFPWLLWALERQALTHRRRYTAVIALLATAVILAGHPQTAAYSLLVAGAYALFRGGGAAATLERLGALSLGLGVALVQLVPTLDLIAASQRHAIDYEWLTIRSISPVALPGLLFPSLFGSHNTSAILPVASWARPDWLGVRESYVGPVVWLLALAALGRWREGLVRFWSAVALVGLVLSLGRFTPAYWFWAKLPFVSQMPYASRHGLELTFALAMLAAYGVSWLEELAPLARRSLDRAGSGLLGLMALVWAGIWLYGPRFAARTQPFIDQAPGVAHPSLAVALAPWQPAFWLPILLVLAAWAAARSRPALAVVLLAMDLWSFHRHHGPDDQLAAVPASLAAPTLPDWSQGRSLTVTAQRYPYHDGYGELALLRREHYPDISMTAGEPTINGYDAFLPARYGRLLGMDSFGHAGEYDPALWGPAHHALDLLGLQTLRLEPEVAARPEWRERLVGERWQRRPDQDGLVVLGNPRALPHAWRVTRARQLDPTAVDRAVAGQTPFEPRAEALLEEAPPAGSWVAGEVMVTNTGLGSMKLVTNGAGPGLVVIGSGYDPGWQAFDARGQALAVLRADAILTAVAVPAGAQEVTLRYRPQHWGRALGLAGGSLALLLLWLAFGHRRWYAAARPRGPGEDQEQA